jgi:putative lipoprotein
MGRDTNECAPEEIWWWGSKVVRRRILLTMALLFSAAAWWTTPMMKAQEMPPTESSAPKSHRMPVMYKFSYSCDGGAKVMVYLRERNARVVFADKSYSMKQVEAASGTKYSDGKTVWWSKGEEGFLRDETQPDQPVRLAENCKLENPPSPATAVVSGTVAYRERIAMPENAVLTIELQDMSVPHEPNGADAPAKVIAEQKFTFAGHQVPLPFELHYDPATIDPKHTYALSARITIADQLMFMNTTAYRVITQGNPVKADILLQMVEGQTNGSKQ